MSLNPASQKVTDDHLKRDAYLYVRQSTVRQVFENTESTHRQYALRQRAVALGWSMDRVVVIDSDLGKSGASPGARAGFQRLVSEVGMGRAGIVLGLEVSRLARNSTDWHRLLEICALTETLILDEDGIYDPTHFNDRLLLGLKGTMSEAELHVLRARLRGGIVNKAERGELRCPLPVGLTYNTEDKVVLDPDAQVKNSLYLLFRTFRRTGSAMATVKAFRKEGIPFPRRLRKGLNKGDVVWGQLEHTRVLQILHNPRYAGAFVFGRSKTYKRVNGHAGYKRLPQDQWHTLILDAHPGYVSWQEYEKTQRRLRENAQVLGSDRRKSPPREGPALLQGLAVCGVCGTRMSIRYHQRHDRLVPDYVCQQGSVRRGERVCQAIPGASIDETIGDVLVSCVTPMALEVALQVQGELQGRFDEAERLRRQQVDRAKYEADLARRRFMQVDPSNRLVADTLEGEWNDKLRRLAKAQEDYERKHKEDSVVFDETQRAKISALASDFSRLWRDPQTPARERKRMVRLLIQDVTLIKAEKITMHIRFKGGSTQSIEIPRPPTAWQMRKTSPDAVAEIDRLLGHHTEKEIADLLNQRGYRSGADQEFSPLIVGNIRRGYHLTSRYDRLRERGMLTRGEIATMLDVAESTIKIWRGKGLLHGHAFNNKNEFLYEHPGDNPPIKSQGQKLAARRRFASNPIEEVQCEA